MRTNLNSLLLIGGVSLLLMLSVSCARNETAGPAREGEAPVEGTGASQGAADGAMTPSGDSTAQGAIGSAARAQQAAPSGGAAARPAGGSTAAARPPATPSGAGSMPSGWDSSPETKPAVSTVPAAPVLKTYTLPSGSTIRVQTTSALSTKTVQQGAAFAGSLAEPITVDGTVIASRGANVAGRVLTSDGGGRVKGKAYLEIAVTSIELVNGESVTVETAPFGQQAKSAAKKDAVKVGIASGVGAAIGAIAGGGKGAAIGAGVGAGAGTGAVLATKGDPAVIPAETVINFRTQSPISVKLK